MNTQVLQGLLVPFLGTTLGALLTIGLAAVFAPMMPVMLSFAAGAMLYVVVEELVPEMAQGTHTNVGTVLFAVGFSLMMAMDYIL